MPAARHVVCNVHDRRGRRDIRSALSGQRSAIPMAVRVIHRLARGGERSTLNAQLSLSADAQSTSQMTLQERTLADYKGTGMTVGPHLMQYLRSRAGCAGRAACVRLAEAAQWQLGEDRRSGDRAPAPRHGEGVLLSHARGRDRHRQRRRRRPTCSSAIASLIHTASLLLVEGPLQSVDDVIHVRARRFRAAGASAPSHLPDRLRLPHARHARGRRARASEVARLPLTNLRQPDTSRASRR